MKLTIRIYTNSNNYLNTRIIDLTGSDIDNMVSQYLTNSEFGSIISQYIVNKGYVKEPEKLESISYENIEL